MLLAPDSAPVLALFGLGGIGKTALADAAIRRIIPHFHFEQVVWLRVGTTREATEQAPAILTEESLINQLARTLAPNVPTDAPAQFRKAQVREILKSLPCLVVIDNLEMTEESAQAAASLHDLADPSKFILTSRTRIGGAAGVYHLPVQELSPAASGELLRDQARRIGLPELASASPAQLQAIHEVIGGNPLAIKLVAGLATGRPLETILADLLQAYSPQVEAMYQNVFWQAWRTLTPEAQALLEVMPLAGEEGMKPAQMQRLSSLEQGAFWPAVDELVHRSLLEVRGSLEQRSYAIHRLTESFLQTNITGWSTGVL